MPLAGFFEPGSLFVMKDDGFIGEEHAENVGKMRMFIAMFKLISGKKKERNK